jgi:hypothetical protein
VTCAFGTLCTKWRIFHRAIDVYPDLCYVTVKIFCTVYNFVRQTDGFQFQDALHECPPESIKAVGTRGTDMGRSAQGTGSTLRGGRWGSWQGLVYRGLMCGRRFWRRASLSIRSGVPRIFFRGVGSTNSVEDRGQSERGSGGGSPLVRGSTQFANE